MHRQASSKLQLYVNGKEAQASSSTLGELVVELGYGERRIATAVNGEFVRATCRSSTLLKDGDRIEIVAPRQGG